MTQGVGVVQVGTAAVVALATEVSVLAPGFVKTASSVMCLLMELSIQEFVAVSVQGPEISVLVLPVVLEGSAINLGWFPLFAVL